MHILMPTYFGEIFQHETNTPGHEPLDADEDKMKDFRWVFRNKSDFIRTKRKIAKRSQESLERGSEGNAVAG